MTEFRLQNELFRNEEVLGNYANVFVHCEDNSIVEGHMLILAQQSPFCHRFFQSRKMEVADMIFPNIRHSVVRSALRIMYGKVVNVSKSDSKRICAFLNMLQVKYQVTAIEESPEFQSTGTYQTEVPIQDCQLKPLPENSDKGEKAEEGSQDWNRRTGNPDYQNTPVVIDDVTTATEPKQHDVMDNLENWTLTTTDWGKVDAIGHTIERDEAQNRNVYKCNFCPVSSRVFDYAAKHFTNKHKDIKKEQELILSVQKRRNQLMKDFDNVSDTGVNMTLVNHESTVILGDLETLAAELSKLPNDLPVQLDFKKKDFTKKLSADILAVKTFIDKIV